MSLKLHNTLTRQTEDFAPLRDGHVRIYVCGLTPSAQAHLGHARSFLFFDVLRRYLEFRGYRVTYVQNVTDIDDRSIARALETGDDWREIVAGYYAEFKAAMRKLGVREPDAEPYATAFIASIQTMIRELVEKKYAYASEDGIYYRVGAFARYGHLSRRNVDELLVGARIEVDEHKDDPLDFALWKFAKSGEPSWPFEPYGAGRPGWHIECSAMSTSLLGPYFDLHGGGMDLKFPHHENEIAQSCAACGAPFVHVWMHNGFVRINDDKMSKSLGNFFTVRDVLKTLRDPEVMRIFLLSSHYRGPINYSEAQLNQADETLLGLYRALDGVDEAPGRDRPREASAGDATAAAALARFNAAMDDDFNTPEALAVMQGVARDLNSAKAGGARESAATLASALRTMGKMLGLLQQPPAAYSKRGVGAAALTDPQIEELLAARRAARGAKNFAESDRIRDVLASAGVLIEDKPGGATGWRRA